MTQQNPSALAMCRYIEHSEGLRRSQLSIAVPGLPTLPGLKLIARDRRSKGHEVVDQSAGDIADVGEPLADEFVAFIEEARDELIAAGVVEMRRTRGDAYGYSGNYQQQYPAVTDRLAHSWGITATKTVAIQTISGRIALDMAMRALMSRHPNARGQRAIILDTLAWSGYQPLAEELGLALVHAAAHPEHGLSASAEGLTEAIEFCERENLVPVAAIPILPSNPTGVGMAPGELERYVEVAAAADLPVLVDAFYSPLAPEGHLETVGLNRAERGLAPEVLGYLGVLVGETKVTSSQNKTATVMWFAPERHDAVAIHLKTQMMKRLAATNTYPRPQEALVAYALHSFPKGIHAAMGPRFVALDDARSAMAEVCDDLGLPFSIGGSFYGTVALVDDDGRSLIRDESGKPATDAKAASEIMIQRYGLVGAPGAMFSPAPEAAVMARLTAAVTLADVEKVRGIFTQMLEAAKGS